MTTIPAGCVFHDTAIVGESPVWHAVDRKLYWVDIQGRSVNRFDPASGTNQRFPLPEIVTSLHFRREGGLVVTLRKEFAYFDCETGELQKFAGIEADKPGNRFNDSACDRAGRLWAGTMNAERWDQPEGALYRLNASMKPEKIRSEVICSNGTDWSPDGRVMYHTESFRYAIFAFDYDQATGTPTNRRIFCQLDPKGGEFPDGLCVDAEGFVWSAQVGQGRIVRYDPEGGRPERSIQLPVTRGTSCAFGGDALDTLYITTARETLTPEMLAHEPLAGSLFSCRPGVIGLPASSFVSA